MRKIERWRFWRVWREIGVCVIVAIWITLAITVISDMMFGGCP